ncbi:DUF1553 domain-containing protein [Durusdinium trenchii]|uniref:DUF1553 domain-containing protein n=1 Tax=Durusdinium trenchii TaxID=1381693 RepID=A0ABP0HVE8_9DINO
MVCALLVRPSSATSAEPLVFERDVRPLLKTHCFHCHGEEPEVQGSLDVRLVRWMESGGDSGTAVVKGSAEESLLYQRIRDGEMPPDEGKQLSHDEIAIIRQWIDEGAQTARPEPESIDGPLITEEERSYWAFLPIERIDPPSVEAADRARTPIDSFLLSRLEEQGFSYAEEASRLALLRRASIDLTGLPPTLEEAQQFLADEVPGAYERLVDRLLSSPAYGERWGRHWLDVAGYADSEGYNSADAVRNHAFRYRDYVIRAFNADKPFDQFILEQLAGDELVTSPLNNLTPEDAELLAATGFLRMAPDGTGGAVDDAAVARNEVIAETIKIVSTSLMGMTVGCAQCHDHRYDPIPQADYYALRAVFDPALDWKQWKSPRQRLVSMYTDADREVAAEIEAEARKIDAERKKKQDEYIAATFEREVKKLPEEIQDAAREARETPAKERTADQKKLLKKYPSLNVSAGSLYLYDRKAADKLKAMAAKAKELRETKPKEEFIRALVEPPGASPVSFVFFRGDHEQPHEEVAPRGLTVLDLNVELPSIPAKVEGEETTGRRTALAKRLTDPNHPLTARVIANRIWMHHFGRGLVATPGDFGVLGARPTHPQLLDWLARELIESGWSVKHLHRMIMMSAAYRQSTRGDEALVRADPDNELCGRAPLRRLEAEVVRDATLLLTGTLNRELYGPPVPVMADRVGRWVLGIENLNAGRPGKEIALGGGRSTGEALMLMNSDFVLESSTTASAVQFLIDQQEIFASQITSAGKDDKATPELQALASLCHMLLSSNEFLYVE